MLHVNLPSRWGTPVNLRINKIFCRGCGGGGGGGLGMGGGGGGWGSRFLLATQM